MSYFFHSHPWDLEDDGLDAALGRLAGEIGVDAVSVTGTDPGIRELRGRPIGGRWTFQCGAAAHFQPESKYYTTGRIRPIVAAWMKSRNPLERIARVAERERLKLRVALDCCAGRELVERYSHAACVDLFGATSDARLCPSNPDFRAYVAALMEDVSTNYPVETIELAGLDFGAASIRDDRVESGIEPSQADHAFLAWCFCASCRQRAADAGITPDVVVAAILSRLDAASKLESRDVRSFRQLLSENDVLAAYQRMRVDSVVSLARSVRSKATCRVIHRLEGDLNARAVDPASLISTCDAVIVRRDGEGDPSSPPFGNLAIAAERLEIGLTCRPPHSADGPSLVASTLAASRAGYAAIGFENYGLTPEPCLEWVRQAIRFARRETGR